MREGLRRAWRPALLLSLLAVVAVGLLTAPARPVDRAAALERQVRCPVCKSVSVADSPSGTAAAIRREIRQQVAAGRSDDQILDYFRARFGAWAILDPPARGVTLLVWVLPLLALLVAAGTLVLLPARRSSVPPLPDAERDLVRRAADSWRDATPGEVEP